MTHSSCIASDDAPLHGNKTRDVAPQECSTAPNAVADGCLPTLAPHIADTYPRSIALFPSVVTPTRMVALLLIVCGFGLMRGCRCLLYVVGMTIASLLLMVVLKDWRPDSAHDLAHTWAGDAWLYWFEIASTYAELVRCMWVDTYVYVIAVCLMSLHCLLYRCC